MTPWFLDSRRLSPARGDPFAFWVCLIGLAILLAALAIGALMEAAWGASPPLTRRTAILLDVSGSMRGHRIGAARGALAEVIQQPTDEWHVRLYAFSGTLASEGGWHRLPDGEQAALLAAWAAAFEPDGDTRLWGALDQVLAENADVDDLSVLVITDGGTSRDDATLGDVLGASRAIHVLAVEPCPSDARALRALADGTGGEYREIPGGRTMR